MTFSATQKPQNFEVYAQFSNTENRVIRAIRQGWFTIGAILKQTARDQILKDPKTGRIYLIRRGQRRRRHQASAPAPAGTFNLGESPANLSGDLRRSIGYKVSGWEEMEFGALEDRAPPYARALALGNPARNLEPRPYTNNAWLKNQGNLVAVFQQTIKAELK